MNVKAHRPRLFPIVVGNLFEWYDFALYGFFATTIGMHFFPSADGKAAVLASTATFGAAFVMRPIGAVVLGAIGDRYGRKSTLTATILLMALGTAMIASAPTYASVGIAATLMVVAGRLLQGFSASGEAGLAIALLMESTEPARRGMVGAWFAIGMYGAVVLGSLAALAVNSLLPAMDAREWGWRLPFIAGLLIVPIGFYARRALSESHEFLTSQAARQAGNSVAGQTAFSGIAAAIGLAAFGTASIYLLLVFMPAYAERELGMLRQQAILSTFLASLLLVLLLLPGGWLSDRIGRKPMINGASLIACIVVVPLFMHVNESPTFAALLTLQLVLAVCMAAYASSAPVLMSSLFPVGRRALGIGLGYNLGILIFGGFAPFFTAWLREFSGSSLIPAYYVACSALITLAATLRLPEPDRQRAAWQQ